MNNTEKNPPSCGASQQIFDCEKSSRSGPIGYSSVSYEQRKKLEKLLNKRLPLKEVCGELKMSRSTVYYERLRMGDLSIPYDAEVAQKDFEKKQTPHLNSKQAGLNAFRKRITRIYKELKKMEELGVGNKAMIHLKNALIELESLGVNPERMKKPTTLSERKRILELHEEGLSYTTIAAEVNRSRDTVKGVIYTYSKKFKEEENKEKEEILHEELKSKWLSS